jgi:hypothetical protein
MAEVGQPLAAQRGGMANSAHHVALRESTLAAPGPALFRRRNSSVQGFGAEADFSNFHSPVAVLNISADHSIPRRVAGSYAPPTPLQDLHILDVLELAGSQYRAGAALSMHQSTVCRSLKLMQRQFQLVTLQGAAVCRYGHNACLHYLRLAYREHRLMAGLLRIGSDVLHQSLLAGLPGVQQVPARFRRSEHWAELVRHGLLDGAIVSSFALADPERAELPLGSSNGLVVLPLGDLTFQLVAAAGETEQVLVPARAAVPLLHQALEAAGFELVQQPQACQEAQSWLKHARDRHLALPICTPLVGADWLAMHRLVPLQRQPRLIEQLWLLLPQTAAHTPAARQCLRRLRTRLASVRRYAETA